MVPGILEDLIRRLVPHVGGDVVVTSAALAGGREVVIRQMERVAALRPLTIVEIGTRDGVMAALLSYFTECVITFDSHQSPRLDEVRALSHVRNVAPALVSDWGRGVILERLDFDLAFIDVGQNDRTVAAAFDDVRRCGTVLLHGYGVMPGAGVTRFVDSLTRGTVEPDPPFAWWWGDKDSLRP